MTIKEVKDGKTKKDFLEVVTTIYKSDQNWIRPLNEDIEGVFDPNQNSFFNHGEVIRWVLYSDANKPIGRVAAFINEKKAYTYDSPTGGMGFFECIDNEEASFLLFNTCKEWLESKKMEAMDGPINFGENDRFWGLLIDGFTPPGYGMAYNPPYYQKHFEAYGFKLYYEQISNHLDLASPLPERFSKIAQWAMKKPGYRFEHFKLKDSERFVNDFVKIYNDGWQFHENFSPITVDEARDNIAKMKPILEERLIWFVYVNDEPAAFMVLIPDVNQIIKHLNGKLNLWSKLKFAYLMMRKSISRMRLVIMGVVPKYQKAGLEACMIMKVSNIVKQMPQYKEAELSWVGDFNPKMRALQESVGASFGKKHYTYRKMFNDSNDSGRSTIIAKDTKEQLLN